MGTPADRAAYATVLQAWLRDRLADLAPDDAAKVESHPLRVLDSKRTEHRAVLVDAPRMAEHPDAASLAYGERVQAGLRAVATDLEDARQPVRRRVSQHTTLFQVQLPAPG